MHSATFVNLSSQNVDNREGSIKCLDKRSIFRRRVPGEARIVFRTSNQMINRLLLKDNAILRIWTKRPTFEVNYSSFLQMCGKWPDRATIWPFPHKFRRKNYCMFGSNQGIQFRPHEHVNRILTHKPRLDCLGVITGSRALKSSHGGLTAQMGFYYDLKWATNWRTLLTAANELSIVFALNTICPF